MTTKFRIYQKGETVPIWIEAQDWNDEYVDPTQGVKLLHITDPDGVVKAGYLKVAVSASFIAGLVVTGATSGAKGLVISKPDDTTLELQQITGVWQSGEVIKDTSIGESITASAITAVPMDTDVKGYYHYNYTTLATDKAGWWRYRGRSQDGTSVEAKYTVVDGGFELQ